MGAIKEAGEAEAFAMRRVEVAKVVGSPCQKPMSLASSYSTFSKQACRHLIVAVPFCLPKLQRAQLVLEIF